MGEEVRVVRSTDIQLQNSPGDGKYSVGDGEDKELICVTRGHDPWWGDCLREWGALGGGGKREKSGQL